jgi:hypothetical protein
MSANEHPSELTGLELFACARQLLNAHHTAEAAEQELIDRGVSPDRAKEVVATLVAQRTRQAMDRKTQQLLHSDLPPEEVARQLMERGIQEDQARRCIDRVQEEEAIQRGYRLGIAYRWWGMIFVIVGVILVGGIRHALGKAVIQGGAADWLVVVAAMAIAGGIFYAGRRMHKAGKDRTGLG